jgi:hypothetical protein
MLLLTTWSQLVLRYRFSPGRLTPLHTHRPRLDHPNGAVRHFHGFLWLALLSAMPVIHLVIPCWAVPAPPVCGVVLDATTRKPVVGAKVDCTNGIPSMRGCSTATDSLGFFGVGACEDPMVFTAQGFDTLRVEDWTKVEKPCKEQTTLDCIELRDLMLIPSRRPLENR